jgi:hypothetical protein
VKENVRAIEPATKMQHCLQRDGVAHLLMVSIGRASVSRAGSNSNSTIGQLVNVDNDSSVSSNKCAIQ